MIEFNAAPKIIKSKPKYNPKSLNPIEMENEYIVSTKFRNKEKNLNEQINKFRNGEYDNPYNIKPITTNKIDANLDFFLIESTREKVKQLSIDVQTDNFNPINNKYDIYIPPKTGIDVFTQVENDELFDFDEEVAPIINIIITKTLEQSVLEVEEEMEIENMKRFKEAYFQKKLNKDDSDTKKIIEVEKEKIKNKDLLLVELREKRENLNKTKNKIFINNVSSLLFKDLFTNTINDLESIGYYNDYNNEKNKNKLNNILYNDIDNEVNNYNSINNFIDELLTKNNNIIENKLDISEYNKYLKCINFGDLYYDKVNNLNRDVNNSLIQLTYDNCLMDYFNYNLKTLSENKIEDFEQNIINNYTDTIRRISENILNENEVKEIINDVLPQKCISLNIKNIKKINVLFSNNPYKYFNNVKKIFDIIIAFYDKDNKLSTIINKDIKNDYLSYCVKRYDIPYNIKYNENYDEIYYIDLENIRDNDISNMVLFIKCIDINLFKNINISEYDLNIKIIDDITGINLFNTNLNLNEVVNSDQYKAYINEEENINYSFNEHLYYMNKPINTDNSDTDRDKLTKNIIKKDTTNNNEILDLKDNVIDDNDNKDMIQELLKNDNNNFTVLFFISKVNIQESIISSNIDNNILFTNYLYNFINILGNVINKYSFNFNYFTLGERLVNNKTDIEEKYNNLNIIINNFSINNYLSSKDESYFKNILLENDIKIPKSHNLIFNNKIIDSLDNIILDNNINSLKINVIKNIFSITEETNEDNEIIDNSIIENNDNK